MAEVKVYARAIRGSEHVHSESEGAFVYFIPWVEVNGHTIVAETPGEKAFRERLNQAALEERLVEGETYAYEGERGSIAFDVTEGFAVLTIRHASDLTWEFLQTLDPNDYEYESNREEFNVFVTKFEFKVLEPKLEPVIA